MAKSIRSILRLPLTMRNLSTFHSRSLPLSLVRSSSSARPVNNGGASLQTSDNSIGLRMRLYERIADCRTSQELFALIREEKDHLNVRDTVRCLQALAGMVKGKSVVTQERELFILCDKLTQNIGQLREIDMIRALRCLKAFQFSATDPTPQFLMRQLRNCVQQLSLEQIIATKRLLQKYEKSMQVDALNTVLDIATECHLSKQYDGMDVKSLVRLLNYNTEAGNAAEVSKILRILQQFDDSSYTPKEAKTLLFLLMNLEPNDAVLKLLSRLQDIVTRNMSSFNARELKVLLLKASPKSLKQRKISCDYYHKALYNACANAVVVNNLGFSAAIDVLYYLYLSNHVNVDLLQYIAWQCLENPNILRNASECQVERFVAGLSMADYRPTAWHTLKSNLMETKIDDYNPTKLTRLAVHLASLGCYWKELIAKVFTSPRAMRRHTNAECKHLLLLYHAVRNSFPEYQGPWPSSEFLQSCENFAITESKVPIALNVVEIAVGGSQNVLSKLRTKFSYYIDHAIAMRNGLPVAINDGSATISQLEELKCPENSKLFLFMNVPKYGYPRNSKRPIGLFSFIKKQIVADTGYMLVLVHQPIWLLMSTEEQIKYIRKVIGMKHSLSDRSQLSPSLPKHVLESTIANSLRACRTPKEILTLIQEKMHQLTGHDAVTCLLMMFDMDKKNRTMRGRLLLEPQIGIVCRTIMEQANQLTGVEALCALKCFSHFNLPDMGYTTSPLLQQLQASINQLILEDIIFLKFLLSKQSRTRQVEELDDQLLSAFKTEIIRQPETRTPTALIKALDFIMNNKICSDMIPKILCAIEKFPKSAYTPQCAKNLLFYLMDLEPNESVTSLIPRMQDIVTENLDSYTKKELDIMLLKMYRNAHYNEALLDGVAATVVSRDLGVVTGLAVLERLLKMRHISTDLIEYVATKCLEDPTVFQTEVSSIHRLTQCLAKANYKPANWDPLRHVLMDERILSCELEHQLLTASDLVKLDCYWWDLLAKVFTAEPQSLYTLNFMNLRYFLLLYHAVRNNYSRYGGPWPSQEFIQKCEDCPVYDVQRQLGPMVEAAVGGPRYVLSGLIAKPYVIDHMIVMRKGGFPVAINCGAEKIDNLNDVALPQDSEVILLLEVPERGYSRNTKSLVGFYAFLVKLIETSTKHTVIPIDATICQRMSEREQIKYIAELIRLKCNALSSAVN